MTGAPPGTDPNIVGPHDRRLEALVRPAAWTNPTPPGRYHLVVIGAGTAGLVTAAAAASLGARVALIERHRMGGDCLNVGCVPSKGVISAARAWHLARQAHADFGGPMVTGSGDFATALDRMRRLRADLASVDSAERFKGLGVDLYFGEGRFTSPDRIAVDGAELSFRRAVIATGARAAIPPVPGLAELRPYTNETIFDLTAPPRHLLVIGAGPIGCELAQSFARLGVVVSLVDRAPRVLPRDDEEASRVVQAALRREGVHLHLGADLQRAERNGDLVSLVLGGAPGNVVVEGDAILVAAGRHPNVDGLGLDAAGIAAERTGITVDDRLRTSHPRVFAIGDVASRYQFTHAADFQARLVLSNALFFGRGRASKLVIPWATYTSPELAQVGLTLAAAAMKGIAVDSVTVPFHEVDRAVLAGEAEGFLRVVLARGTDRIVGITIVGVHAGELIAEGAVAMTNRLGLSALGRTIHPYPTTAEAYRKAADQWRRRKLTPLARRILGGWFRLTS